MNKLDATLETALKQDQAKMEQGRTRLILQGVREDSEEMRKLMDEYFKSSIEALRKYLAELEKTKAAMDPANSDPQVKAELDQKIADAQIQIAQIQVQQKQNKDTKFDEIMAKLQRDLEMKEAEWSVKKSDAILAGNKEDSPAVKAIEQAKAKDMGARIDQTQAQLTELAKQYKGTDTYYDILLANQKLEADQKQLLADIKKNTEKEIGTFNLPQGLRPMTYYEHLAKNANFKQVSTVPNGDVYVSVRVDNLHGEADLKKVTNAIADAAKKAQNDMVTRMSSGVRANHGVGYRPYT
jgi:hypothetical protein